MKEKSNGLLTGIIIVKISELGHLVLRDFHKETVVFKHDLNAQKLLLLIALSA